MTKPASKRKRKPRPQKPPFTLLADGQFIEPGIDREQQRLIGSLVMEWSNVEAALDDLIWALINLGIEEGRVLTKYFDADRKVRIVREIGPRRFEAVQLDKLLAALDDVDNIRPDRNFIVHAVWGTLMPDNLPVGSALRAESPEPDEVTTESFSRNRMTELIGTAKSIRDALVRARVALSP